MAADNSLRVISFGGSTTSSPAAVEHAEALAMASRFRERAGAAAQQMIALMPQARALWAFGQHDWDRRGHAVVSLAVLMGSAASVMVGECGLQGVRLSCPDATFALWPEMIPVTDRLAVSVAASAPLDARVAASRLFQNSSLRQAFRSLDENNTVIVDARSQAVLLEAGLIASFASPQGTAWRLTQSPVNVDALRGLGSWYSQAVKRAVRFLRPVMDEVKDASPAQRALALLVTCGAMASAIPVQDGSGAQSRGLLPLIGRLLTGGKARTPGTVLWADPWGVWDACRQMASAI